MKNKVNRSQYDKPVEIAEGVFWVGFYDEESGLHCNPYLIIEGEEAVLFDGGSRTDFSTVMMKVLQTGLDPKKIDRLIYHHYDPDLCSSIPHFEDIIENKKLKIISHRENNIFIKFYSVISPMLCISSINHEYTFKSGRKLRFINTPYAHSAGSFVTFDEKTGILFSSDIFGGYGKDWDLYMEMDAECYDCDCKSCPIGEVHCLVERVVDFHERIMTSSKALLHALEQFKDLPIKMIAPQHGSILNTAKDIEFFVNKLLSLKKVGIDKYS